jgi:hypothetical protein
MKRLITRVLPDGVVEAWRDHQRRSSVPLRFRPLLGTHLSETDVGPHAAIDAATAWLVRAQDQSRSADGGVARDFSLITGWATSYPETTGYIIPTFLALAHVRNHEDLRTRAKRMLDWLVSIQLPDGGFQGGKIDQIPIKSVTFNTGQILIGLAAGAKEFGDPRYREAMHAAARFLRDSQDSDGAWRSHPTPFAASGDKVYETHASWGLFEAARLAQNEGYGEAGLRQVQWAITRQQPNGWFSDNCLDRPKTPLTHTIGYALRGVIEAYRFSGNEAFKDAALRTATALISCLDQSGRIPGRLDAQWQAASRSACLTGIVQIAACWFLLAEIAKQPEFATLARRANRYVRLTMWSSPDAPSDVFGGVKGSHPISGEYGRFEYLNWAAKFCIDANLMELA